VSKEEEMIQTKKRFKEEKMTLEADKKRLANETETLKDRLKEADSRFFSFKKEIDESPINVLRNEIN
jgi:hypothetical protein